jgi:hypothetical protein
MAESGSGKRLSVVRDAKNELKGFRYGDDFYPAGVVSEDDLEEVGEYLKRQRFSPMEAIKGEFAKAAGNPRMEELLIDRAFQEMRKGPKAAQVTRQEVHEFLKSHEGTVYLMWVMFKKKDPVITLEQAKAIFREAAAEDMQRRIDEANAELIAANAPTEEGAKGT